VTVLSAVALRTIRANGFTRDQWIRLWGFTEVWGGDRCGCFDDRCANGFHHTGPDDCGCLETMIDDAVAWRTATRSPNRVELVGSSYGLNQWVDVSTPAVLATVSTSREYVYPPINGVVRKDPADSVIRIETREGWSSVVTEEEHHGIKKMVIRFARVTTGEGDNPDIST
jgi:hypothetical protein